MFYIGADNELPLIEPQNWKEVDAKQDGWQSKVVPFSVELLDENNRIVAQKFQLAHVRYAGSFEGCGCGFGACVIEEDPDPPDEHELAGRVSRERLYDYIIKNQVNALYCCWAGDEGQAIKHSEVLDPEKILDLHFDFLERTFYTIRKTVNKRMQNTR
ncbi:MAG: hypothetical protein NT105_08280 [Verrucomicrobia bacterium]|nr:hypothetical protein [Verrucomicrobiota bacterium]